MLNFVRNLALLGFLGIILFSAAPDVMRQVVGIFGGLGILPVVFILVLMAALPRKGRRRRRDW